MLGGLIKLILIGTIMYGLYIFFAIDNKSENNDAGSYKEHLLKKAEGIIKTFKEYQQGKTK